jgi:hypothetical protein
MPESSNILHNPPNPISIWRFSAKIAHPLARHELVSFALETSHVADLDSRPESLPG